MTFFAMPPHVQRAALVAESVQGMDCVRLSLPGGASALIALRGAQVLSWRSEDGAERLYCSPAAITDGSSALRGGVPVCFPQFNQRGPLVKHGFARNLPWALCDAMPEEGQPAAPAQEGVRAVLQLTDTEQTRAWWPHGFCARLIVELTPRSLQITLTVVNTGHSDWDFTAALHTYLRVPDIARTALAGLEGCTRWDAVRDVHSVQAGPVHFAGEYDSVFSPPAGALQLIHGGVAALHIAHSPSWRNAVVWNPGAQRCAALSDMPPDGFEHMLCVEAACVMEPVALAAGQQWSGWQRLQALPVRSAH